MAVIEPDPMPNLVEVAETTGSFKTLIKAVETAGLKEFLESEGPMTVLAPTDDAFAKLPGDTLNDLLEDIPTLKRVLMYHVLSGDARSDDLIQIDEAPTTEGSVVAINHENGIQVNDARVVQTDILTDNGVIHVIDAVLMPAILAGH